MYMCQCTAWPVGAVCMTAGDPNQWKREAMSETQTTRTNIIENLITVTGYIQGNVSDIVYN